jgi:hypothetical protein
VSISHLQKMPPWRSTQNTSVLNLLRKMASEERCMTLEAETGDQKANYRNCCLSDGLNILNDNLGILSARVLA